MPFELTIFSIIFLYLINNLFCDFLNNFVVYYNILVYSKNIENYKEHISFILEELKN